MQNAAKKSDLIHEKVKNITEKHQNKREVLLSFLIAIALGVAPLGFGILSQLGIGMPHYFLLAFPAIVFSTWYGDIKTGVVTTIVCTFGLYTLSFMSKVRSEQPIQVLLQVILFLISAMFVCYFVEKSKHHEKLAEYKKREKEHIDLILELQMKYAAAQEEIKSRDEFLSIASHELKTPLTSMLLQLQTALHNIRNVSLAQFSVENLLKMLDNTEQQSKRISKMINDLLNVSLITTGRIDLEKEKIDLSEIVKNVCNEFDEKIKKDGYMLRCHTEKPVVGLFDKLRIEQVVTNLVTNAMRYGEKKPIEITVEKHGRNGIISVKDHGIGIAKEQQEKIFNRFERGVNGSKFEGLGVGLYISNQIVKAHKGHIEIDSQENQGTTFTVCLPLEESGN